MNYVQKRNMRMSYKNKSGFTLVELLVVVSIIAVLLAILMPAMNKAREQGKKVQCGAHMKNMALGMMTYSMTYNNYYPALLMPGDLSKVLKGKSHWHQLVLKFADNKSLPQCPSLSVYKKVQWDDKTYITGYGLNYNGWNSKKTWAVGDDPDGAFGYMIPDEPRGGCIKSSRPRHPSSFIMLGDTNGNKQTSTTVLRSNFTYGIIGPPRELGKVNTQGDMPNVHTNGGNISFMDGHIKWYKTVELLSDNMLQMWSRGK
jgi:prepilin-type N-terminal cleavage/methylation domain-containing protein/prepilin-type processing-associated H-X9-DG protein